MDFELSEEQEQLRQSVEAVLARECPITLVRELVEKGAPAEPLWLRMVELGWPALTVPEEHGGIGLGFVELVLVAEELGRVIAPGPLLPTISQFAPAVREAGTTEQQHRFLGGVAECRVTGTLALTEDGTGWDPSAVRTRARRQGDRWVLDGVKRFVAEASQVEEIVVAARTEEGELALFVVPGERVGIDRQPVLDATREHATVHLEDVTVEADRLLGDPGSAAERALRRAVQEATIAAALETVGTCQSIFDLTLDYAKVRDQFGVPIGSFQALKHKLADMLIALERARATGYFAAMTVAEDDPRRAMAASMAKATAGDCQRIVVADGLQIHGGIGYTWEHDLHLYLKRAKAGDGVFGTAVAHRARTADLLGL
jgi:alkylation response protein AidB-like acyl-CoA dehydrogenase